uniref:YqaJ domain-containing protein n=1 Tax=Brugia timori TaxID=42155 RepID=A0A0R3QCG2_9BILA
LHKSGVLGASPDGISSRVVLEIKCPFSLRTKPFKECLPKAKKYIIYFEDGLSIINKEPDYYDQIQAQIHFTGRAFGILVLWNPLDLFAIKIAKEEAWTAKIPYYSRFLPHIISKNTDTNI